MENAIETCSTVHPLPSHQARWATKSSPLVGQTFWPAGGLERPSHKERKSEGDFGFIQRRRFERSLL